MEKIFEKIIEGIKTKNARFEYLLKDIHPNDLADLVKNLSDMQRKKFFNLLSNNDAATIIQEMDDFSKVSIIRTLAKKRAASILNKMSSDAAADILGKLSKEESRKILKFADRRSEELEKLLQYSEDSAGGIMTIEFVSIPPFLSAKETITHLRKIALEAETIYYIYVTDDKNRLIGVLSVKELLMAKDDTLVEDIMLKNVIKVGVDTDQEEVARVITKYNLLAVPVVDEDDHMLGIVTVDDVVDIITEEATEDIYKSAGVSKIEDAPLMKASVINLFKARLPWLIVTLLGGLVAGSVIGFFEEAIESVIVLTMFIPVIMDMGGNVSTQSSTVFVRGIATGEIPLLNIWQYFFREIAVGATIGIATGISLAIIAALWLGFPMLGVVLGVSLFTTIVVAAGVGILVPFIVVKFKLDPALAAGPFVTTIKDITGLLIYFIMATILLGI